MEKRIFGLDLLRTFAVLFVVFAHGWHVLKDTWVSKVIPAKLYFLPLLDGVSIFFVLSGFLIGRILLRTIAKENFNRSMLFEFWIRRWFRTLPNYFLVLTFLVVAAIFIHGRPPEHFLRYYTFSQNMFSPHPGFFGEAWSLSIEEWFYLCIPIPLFLATQIKNVNRRAVVLVWILSVIILCTAFRFYRVIQFDIADPVTWDLYLRKQVSTRMDSLMYGVLAAYISINFEKFWVKAASSAFLVGITLLILDQTLKKIATDMFYLNYFTLSIEAIGTALLLPKLSNWRRSEGILVKIVTFFSLTSYSMYLLHWSLIGEIILPRAMKYIMYFLTFINKYEPLIAYFFYWLITLVLSYLLYRFFEKPVTSLRDRWPSHDRNIVKAFVVVGNQTETPTDAAVLAMQIKSG